MRRHIALLPAAGSGSRMGADCPKQYLPIHGRPLLWYAVQALATHERIDEVVVVVAPDDAWFASHDFSAWPAKVRVVPVGGASRGESVLNGLLALRGQVADNDWILVHDAARPGLDHVLISRLLDELADDPVGGLLALPVADTLKFEQAGRDDLPGVRVGQTRARTHLWQAQTPQMFPWALLLEALQLAEPAAVTDEASAIELMGLAPRLVRGALHNWKVTWPEDLQWAGQWLLAAARGGAPDHQDIPH